MEILYNNKKINNGQLLTVSETQIQPEIKLNVESNNLYTLIVYDPDAVNGTYIHWAIINITNNDIKTGNIIIPYKGPAPPINTGKHHYIFNLYEQNGFNRNNKTINERLFEISNLTKLLGLNKSLTKLYFISENKSKKGGKSRKLINVRYKKKIHTNKKSRRYKK